MTSINFSLRFDSPLLPKMNTMAPCCALSRDFFPPQLSTITEKKSSYEEGPMVGVSPYYSFSKVHFASLSWRDFPQYLLNVPLVDTQSKIDRSKTPHRDLVSSKNGYPILKIHKVKFSRSEQAFQVTCSFYTKLSEARIHKIPNSITPKNLRTLDRVEFSDLFQLVKKGAISSVVDPKLSSPTYIYGRKIHKLDPSTKSFCAHSLSRKELEAYLPKMKTSFD